MERQYYLDIAARGLQMPIVTDLVLHEYVDPEAIVQDGERLGRVLEEAARRLNTPLAVPHMDLELEKYVLLEMLGVPADERAKYHFTEPLDDDVFARFEQRKYDPFNAHLQAHIDSVKYIAEQATDLLPIGMTIGPFSFMTKMVTDPITPIAMAGAGMSAEDDDDIKLIEQTLELATRMILRSMEAQIAAGAKAIFIAEPAANKVYLSPNQIDAGSDIFERFVMAYNRRIKAYMDEQGVDLIFHCCGELTEYMLGKFGELDPAVISLGSSRKLWEDAAIMPKTTVLYGNLPSKRFYSDALITAQQVEEQGNMLIKKMCEVGHPFILGTECDVLSVPGCEQTIMEKVVAITRCVSPCPHK